MTTPVDETLKFSLDEQKIDADKKLATFSPVKITTPALCAAFAAAVLDVQSRWTRLDTSERQIMAPHLAAINTTRELFRGAKAAYKALESTILGKLHDYEGESAETVQETVARGESVNTGPASESSSLEPHDAPGGPGYPFMWEVSNMDLLDRKFLLPHPREITAEMAKQLREHPSETPVLGGVKFTRVVPLPVVVGPIKTSTMPQKAKK